MYGNIRQWFPKFSQVSGLPQKTPDELADLEWWYDVADLSTITKDGSNRVSQINDKSGNTRHMTPSVNEPLYNATGLFGTYPTIDFLASNSEDLTASFNLEALPICQFGIIAAPNGSNRFVFSYYLNGSSTTYMAHQIISNKIDIVYRFTSNTNLGGGATGGSSTLCFYTEKTATTKRKIGLFGDLSHADTQAYGGFDTLAISKLRSVSTGQFYDNSFSEFFGYSSIPTDADKQLIFNYFFNKYGIAIPTI